MIEKEAVLLGDTGDSKPSILDIGVKRGAKSEIARRYEYHGIDIKPKSRNVIHGDICSCPQISDNSFDVVFSTDLFGMFGVRGTRPKSVSVSQSSVAC